MTRSPTERSHLLLHARFRNVIRGAPIGRERNQRRTKTLGVGRAQIINVATSHRWTCVDSLVDYCLDQNTHPVKLIAYFHTEIDMLEIA
jgi:hypothetical protein